MLPRLGLCEVRRPIDLVDLDRDVHSLEVYLDCLPDFHRVGHIRSTDRHHPECGVESVCIPSFRKELPGHVRVVGVVLDVVVVAEHVRRHPVRGDVCGSLIQFDDGGLVDCVVDRLAYLSVREWCEVPWCLHPGFIDVVFAVCVGIVVSVPVVHGEIPDAHAWSDLEAEVLVCLDDIIGRGVWVLHPVDCVVLQRLEACNGVCDDLEDEGVKA